VSTIIQRARSIALTVHAAQRYHDRVGARAGSLPYAYHLAAVVGVLDRFGVDDNVLHAAAWLHDVLEDTVITETHLRAILTAGDGGWPLARTLADEVIVLVRAVTDPRGADGRRLTRREKLPLVLAQVRKAGGRAITLKLADRIANVEASVLTGGGPFIMYQREHRDFTLGLRTEHGVGEEQTLWDVRRMWQHLDSLIETGAR